MRSRQHEAQVTAVRPLGIYEPTCEPVHDTITMSLSLFLSVGLVVSYLPQIIRIIRNKSSLGFSPWFLLLGATSSASSFLNVVTLQWGVVQCCPKVGPGACTESLLGIFQVGLQWAMFIIVGILFLLYYPQELRSGRMKSRGTDQQRALAHGVGYSSQSSSSGSSSSSEDEEADASSINAYSVEGTPSPSGFSPSGLAPPGGPLVPRNLAHRLRREERADASSSAFSRLVPTFWPVWKAPADQEEADESNISISPYAPNGTGTPASLQGQGAGETQNLLAPPAATRNYGSSGISIARLRKRSHRSKRRTPEWSLALALAWVVGIHFAFVVIVTLLLVSSLPPSAFPPIGAPTLFSSSSTSSSLLPMLYRQAWARPTLTILRASSSQILVQRWATFLGVSGTLLAAGQYWPQIMHTAKARLVGSLSIYMMCLQVPGSIIFVYSVSRVVEAPQRAHQLNSLLSPLQLALRPGTDWTSLAAFVCTGVLQLVLLILCVAFKLRQRKEGIDDYGQPLVRG